MNVLPVSSDSVSDSDSSDSTFRIRTPISDMKPDEQGSQRGSASTSARPIMKTFTQSELEDYIEQNCFFNLEDSDSQHSSIIGDDEWMEISKTLRYSSLEDLSSDDDGFKCDFCGQTIATKVNLIFHLRKHTRVAKYQCPVFTCHRKFLTRSNYKRHKRSHKRKEEV